MNKENLRTYVLEMAGKFPELKDQIREYYQLCCYEIEEGGSEQHEIELCFSSIKELINE